MNNQTEISHNVAQIGKLKMHYLKAGDASGEPLFLLHGFPQHSLMWRKMIPALAEKYTVIAPDLRGAGGTTITPDGYDKRTMAADIRELVEQLGYEKINLAGYDKGAAVAYAYAAAHPLEVRRLAFMEYALPGFGIWEKGITPAPDWDNGVNWHAALFTLPDIAESFMAGQERKLLTWFFWHLSCNPSAVGAEDFEEYYRQISKPGALRAGINYYASVWTDGEHNKENAKNKLTMPVLAIGGEASGGAYIAQFLETVAEDIRPAVIKNAGHWLADEQPAQLTEVLLDFFGEK